MNAWEKCEIAPCHLHRECMYRPCRSVDAPALKIGDVVPMPAQKLVVRPSKNADAGGKSLRGAFNNGRGRR